MSESEAFSFNQTDLSFDIPAPTITLYNPKLIQAITELVDYVHLAVMEPTPFQVAQVRSSLNSAKSLYLPLILDQDQRDAADSALNLVPLATQLMVSEALDPAATEESKRRKWNFSTKP